MTTMDRGIKSVLRAVAVAALAAGRADGTGGGLRIGPG